MTTTINLATEATSILAVIEAGYESRYYVRGGFDPRYTDPAARDEAVKALASLSPACAAAFLHGWVTHRDDAPAEPFAWHRWLGGVRVEVAA